MRRDQAGLYVKTTASTMDTGWVENGGSAQLDYKQATADITRCCGEDPSACSR